MSTNMLLATLKMPPELWQNTELDIQQRYYSYMKAAETIEILWGIIEDIQAPQCPQCHRVKGMGASECNFCGWDVRR